MEGVYLTKLGFNWVGLMQARCLFFDQLQWHRKLDMASMVRWLCTYDIGCRRRSAPPHHVEFLTFVWAAEKRQS